MTYKKPKIVVYNEGDATEWAVPQKGLPKNVPLVACGRSSPADCHCAAKGSKAFTLTTCHCTNSGARVSHKVQESSPQAIAA